MGRGHGVRGQVIIHILGPVVSLRPPGARPGIGGAGERVPVCPLQVPGNRDLSDQRLTVKCGIKMTNCPFKLLIDENWINLNIYNFKCHWAESLEISLELCDWSPSSSLWCLSLVSLVLTSIITITARLRSLADMVLAPHGISGIRTL